MSSLLRVALMGLVLSGVNLGAPQAYAGKLQTLRDKTDYSSQEDSDSSSESDDGEGCGWFIDLFFDCDGDDAASDDTVSGVMVSPSRSAPPSAAEQAQVLRQNRFFLPYPYAHGSPGNSAALSLSSHSTLTDCFVTDVACRVEQQVSACIDEMCFHDTRDPHVPERKRTLQSARLQLFADVGQDADALKRGTVGGVVVSNRGLGVETRWTYWLETLPQNVDTLWIGDVNLRLELVTRPAFQFSLGLGPRVLADAGGSAAGVNATAGVELYPIRPLILRMDVDAGNLGAAPFWEAQANLGVVVQRLELYVGAATFRVEDLHFDSAYAGLRVHL